MHLSSERRKYMVEEWRPVVGYEGELRYKLGTQQ